MVVIIKRCTICKKIIWSIFWIGYHQTWVKDCKEEYRWHIPGHPYSYHWVETKKKEKTYFAHHKCIREKGVKSVD